MPLPHLAGLCDTSEPAVGLSSWRCWRGWPGSAVRPSTTRHTAQPPTDPRGRRGPPLTWQSLPLPRIASPRCPPQWSTYTSSRRCSTSHLPRFIASLLTLHITLAPHSLFSLPSLSRPVLCGWWTSPSHAPHRIMSGLRTSASSSSSGSPTRSLCGPHSPPSTAPSSSPTAPRARCTASGRGRGGAAERRGAGTSSRGWRGCRGRCAARQCAAWPR